MTLRLPIFANFVISVISCTNVANGEENNIKVPNDHFSRFLYTWEIMECESRFTAIYAHPLNKNLTAISINGSQHTLDGRTWTESTMSYSGITEPVHSCNADFLVSLYWTEYGNVYTLQQYGFQSVGTVNNVNSVIIAKGQGINNTEILTSSLSGFQQQGATITVVVNATDMSCTLVNQSCWYLEGCTLVRYFRWQDASQQVQVLATLKITQDEFISISVHEKELWLITADGRRAWRRLGISHKNPVGKRWLIFHFHLPYPVTSITVGAAGIFVLMKAGIVAKFQGVESVTPNKPPMPLFQIDTYDNRSIFALTEEGRAIQSTGISAVASGYGMLMQFNRTTKSWFTVSATEHQMIKNIAVGESEVFVLRNGTDASVSVVNFSSKSIVKFYLYDFLSVLEIGAGAKEVLFLINESSLNTRLLCKNTSGYFVPLDSNTFNNLSSISCAKRQCWAVMNNGSSMYIFINQSEPCPQYMAANQLHVYEESLVFMTIDTDRNGMTTGIEKDSGDIFVRFGVSSSSLKGKFWTNLPGTTMKDIAIGRDGIYGLGVNGDFLHFVRKDGNWTTWSEWSPCSVSCNYGEQSRVRFCNRPAPVFGGENCTGNGLELRSCYLQNCTGHEWSVWSSWSTCSGSCPYGQMRRVRVCVEALNSNINNCLGLDQEIYNCPIQCSTTETVFVERRIRHPWQDVVYGALCTTEYTSLTLLSTVNYVMLYFANTTIPRTATIISSFVQFTAEQMVSSSDLVCNVSLVFDVWNARREDFESCSFSGFNYSFPILWTALTWVEEDRGPPQQTPDFHEELQNTITQPGWNGTGPIIVALRDISSGWRYVYSFEGDPTKSASLFIKYNKTIGVPYTTYWTTWSTWSNCSSPCFGGVQSRTRRCMLMDETVEIHSAYCNGSNFKERYCNIQSCFDASNCTLGLQSNGNTTCCMLGVEMHNNIVYEECTFDVAAKAFTCPFDRYGLSYGTCVPINGSFSQWSPWSHCSHDCFTGVRTRTRLCSNPAPKYGGSPCHGNKTEQEYCNTQPCSDFFNCTKAIADNGNITCCMDACVPTAANGFRCNISNFMATGLCVPVDGNLTTWSSWSICNPDLLCANQSVSRTRSCSNPAPLYGGRHCSGQTIEGKICDTGCIPDGIWSNWFLIDACNASCGLGNQSWARKCTDPITTFHLPSFACGGPDSKSNSCLVINCSSSQHQENMATHKLSSSLKAITESRGQTMTSEISGVSQHLGTASLASFQRKLSVSVSNTERSTETSIVAGEASKVLYSRAIAIPSSVLLSTGAEAMSTTISRSLSASSCHTTPGEATGYSVMSRICIRSSQSDVKAVTPDAVHETSLAGSQSIELPQAGLDKLQDVSPTLSVPSISPDLKTTFAVSQDDQNAWALWGECSTTCGTGTKTRFRKCNRDQSCTENIWESVICMNEPCPVHGGWSDWSMWSACDQTCNGGWKFSNRSCNNPLPKDGGLPCDGVATVREECNLHICPVNGGWSKWTEWSLCDKPCNSGLRKRYRFCDSPKLKYGGADCMGDREQVNVCNEHACQSVLVNVSAKFIEEVFTTDLLDKETSRYKILQAKILENAKAVYKNSSVILGVQIYEFRNGSVFAEFSLEYREVSAFEIVALVTYIDEKRMLGTMPVWYWFLNSTDAALTPRDIKAKAISSSVIRIRWATPCSYTLSCTDNITGYSVSYKKAVDTDAESWNTHVAPPTASSADVTRLSPYFLYTFRVSAMTHRRLGLPSAYVDARTIQGVPTRPPRDFECKAESTTSIFCGWKDIPNYFRNGEVVSYHIGFRRYSRHEPNAARPWRNVTVSFTQRYHTFDNLEVFTRYEFEIQGCTMAGAGPVVWWQVMTHEGVPSSPPWNITVESLATEHVINVNWKAFPRKQWNGRPFGISLSYSIFKRGPIRDFKAKTYKVLLSFDQTYYNITGLDVNWSLSIQLAAQTIAGEGPLSDRFTGETCRCHKNIYVSWFENKPYISVDTSGSVVGIFPKLLDAIRKIVCGRCTTYGYPSVFYDRTKTGRSPNRISYQDLQTKISDEVHIHLPIIGDKALTVLEGTYQYIQVFDDTSSVFITLDQMKLSKASILLNLIYKSYPILIIIILFITTTGIVIWLLDQCNNPQELQKGNFLRGIFNGIWWAFVTMTTVGYGDIIPRGCIGRIFSLAWMIVGLVLTSVFISTLSAVTTASKINNRIVIYGTKIGALYGSKEYFLAVRRLAKIVTSNSRGYNFTTSKDVLQAVIDSEVKGALIETNEAAALLAFMSANNLLVRKKIDSTKGVGFVLSGGMAGLHSEIRAHVKSNQVVLDNMLKNKTKILDVQNVTSSYNQVNDLSALFNESIRLSIFVLGTLFSVGLLWHSCLWRCIKNLKRTHPWSKEVSIQERYKADSEELINLVDSFAVNHAKRIEDLFEKQMCNRFQLVISHSKTTPFGPKGWVHYKTLSSRQIMSEIKATEVINENLFSHFGKVNGRRQKDAAQYPSKLYEPTGIEATFEPIGFILEDVED